MVNDAIFLAVSFLAAMVATLTGFGASTLLVPVGVMFMDLKTAVFLVACFHLFGNLFKVKLFRDKVDFRTFLIFGIPSIVFAFAGAILISVIPAQTLKKILAAFLIIYSLHSLIYSKTVLKKNKASAVIGGSLSGLLAGLIGLGGAIRAAFLIAFDLPKEVYIATSAAIALVIDMTRIPTYLLSGVVRDSSRYVLLPLLIISAYCGVKTGKALLGRISQDLSQRIVLTALLFVGLKLLLG